MPVVDNKSNIQKIKMVGDYSKLIPYFIKHFNTVKSEYKEEE